MNSSRILLAGAFVASSLVLAAGLWLRTSDSAHSPAAVPAAVAPQGTAANWQGPTLGSTTGAQVIRFDPQAATWNLSGASQDGDPLARVTWSLTKFKRDKQDTNWLIYELPFNVPKGQRRFAPEGMVVRVNGIEATFAVVRAPATQADAPVWRFHRGGLAVSSLAEITSVEVVHPDLLSQYRRLDWSLSKADGLSEADFVKHGITFKEVSREGLLMPAPSTGTWAGVTLPSKALFTASVTLAPTPVERRSDGAAIALSLHTADGVIPLGRTAIRGDSEGFADISIDLSAHAGATGDLVLSTETGDDPTDDYVFVGAPAITGTPDGDVRRVVVIGIDTFRPDHLGMNGYARNTSPEIDAWADSAVAFDKAWTSAPRTRPSFRASTTGRLPLDAVCATNIGEVFRDHGFTTAGIVANIHLNPRFDFHRGFDLWQLDSGAKANQQVDRAISWLDETANRDSYLFLHIMDPHVFYVAPPPYGDQFTDTLPPLGPGQNLRGKLTRSNIYAMMKHGELDDLMKDHLRARYDGEIAFTSAHLGRLFEHLDALPGKTLVVLHSDHGEEFWEHGAYEHNHTLYNETTKSVFVVRPPGGTGQSGARTDALATLQDIGPTLYDFAGITDAPPTDGISLLGAMRGEPTDADRAIPVAHVQFEAQRWGVVWRDHKYVLWTGTGREELYNLAADPSEQHDLSGTTDTSPWWRQLSMAHKVAVGRGWRVSVEVPSGESVTLTLPADAFTAAVLDPEAVTEVPVNRVWGETPPVSIEDVGTAVLTTPRTLQITGGAVGTGVVYVLFADDVDPELIASGGPEAEIPIGKMTGVGTSRVRIDPGVVLVPPTIESERMAACLRGEGTEDEYNLLKELGYVDMHDHGDDEDDEAPSGKRGKRNKR